MSEKRGIEANNKKNKKYKVSMMILGLSVRLFLGLLAGLFLFLSYHSSSNNEIYKKYTQKVLSELERHELLKHQIAQGNINIEPEKLDLSKNNKTKSRNSDETTFIKTPILNNEVITTKVLRNKEEIKLTNATISNNSYTIITQIDFRNTRHPFSNNQSFCRLVTHLAPEMKENIFTTVKFGDFIIRKDLKKSTKSNSNFNQNDETVDKNCTSQPTIITIETKFYPKDLQTSPYQMQNISFYEAIIKDIS